MKKFLSVMALCLWAYCCLSQESFIRLESGKIPLKTMLEHIQQQTGIIIFYSDEVVKDHMSYTNTEAKIELELLLQQALGGYNLAYKHTAAAVLAIFPANAANAATNKPAFIGKVSNSLGIALEFASIKLFDESRLLSITSTDLRGNFRLAGAFRPGNRYNLQVSSIGHATQMLNISYDQQNDSLHIQLVPEQITLQSITVKAKKPPFERIADRLIVHVEGSILESGLNTLEILQRSPGLWVDPNGGIRIRGNQGVQVMINDVVQRMSAEMLAEYLRQLPAESISKIEIIPNPAAEYEAAGTAGIIRIVLRKNTLDGFRANILARYTQQGKDPYYNTGTIVDFRKSKFYISAVAAITRNDEYIRATNDVSYADQTKYYSYTDRYRKNKGYNGRITAVYEIDEKQHIGFQTLLTGSRNDQYFYTDNTHFRLSDTLYKKTVNNWLTRPKQLSTTLNYAMKRDSLGSSLKLIADYVANVHREENKYILTELHTQEQERYINYSLSNTKIYSMQADWVQYYISDFNWLAGLKYINTVRNNEVLRENWQMDEWIKDPKLSNEFNYNEGLFMGYLALNYKRNHSALKLGLRAENTHVNAYSITSQARVKQNYLNLFPSIYFSQKLPESQHTFFVNYAKRLRRPSFRDLNPYTLQIDDFILLQGNADLKPEFAHRLELGTQLKQGMSAELFYTYTRDKIALFTETIDNTVLAYQSRNFHHSVDYGINIFTSWKLFSWWSGQANAVWYKTKFELDSEDLSQQTWEISLSQQFKLMKRTDANIYFGYTSARKIANTKYAELFNSSLQISQRLMQDKAKLTLQVNDLFNTFREKEWTVRQGTTLDFYQKRPTQTFGISFTYSISKGKKIDDKKIEQSNSEVQKRAN